MPFVTLRSFVPAILRPVAVVGLVAGFVVALLGGSAPARPVTRVASFGPVVPSVAPAAGTSTAESAVPRAASHAAARPAKRPVRHQPARPAHASRSHHRTGWMRPVHGPVTSGYGRRWGSFHPGIDIGARYGSKVHAITAGRVVSAGWIPGYGKVVRVRFEGKVFYYPHLSRIWTRHGHVHMGQVVGRVGSTGYSTGPHLHIEIRRHGHAVNPRPVLRRHGVHL